MGDAEEADVLIRHVDFVRAVLRGRPAVCALLVGLVTASGVSAGTVSFADLSVTKVDTPDPVSPGANLTYTITVTNAGPDSASSATLLDNIPASTTFASLTAPNGWTCSTPAVGSGGTVSCSIDTFAVGNAVFTLVVAVDPSASTIAIINLAAASSATIDPNPENEIGVATTNVAALVHELAATKVDTPDPVAAGADLTYTITVTNAGPDFAGDVNLNDTLPAGTTFQSLSAPSGWSCSTPPVGAGGTVTCSLASFAPGSVVFTLIVGIGSGIPNGTVLHNAVVVTSPAFDPSAGLGVAETTVVNGAAVSATKTAAGLFTAGSTVNYTVVLTNSGLGNQDDNPGDEFMDILPSTLTLVNATATSGTATPNTGTNTVTWNGSIPAGGSVTITITATINAGTEGQTVSNQGTINYDADSNGTNESTAQTDDPSTTPGGDATTFAVLEGDDTFGIPTLDTVGLALLALLLALGGAWVMRRKRSS